jgi:CRP-like cAMP-binding protein
MSAHPALYGYVVHEETFSKNGLIVKEGKQGAWVYLILEGRVKLVRKNGTGTIVFDTLDEGEIFGEIDFLEGTKSTRGFSVLAAEDRVRVGLLDTELLIEDYEAAPPQIRIILKSLMRKLKEMIDNTCTMVTE